jgi:hypothetical protein
MPARGLLGREAGAEREAAADALGASHDVGLDAVMLIGEERAGAGDAALDLVEHQHQVIARRSSLRSPCMNSLLAGRMPPSPWIGSTRKPAVFSSIAASRRLEIVELDDLEARQQRREAVAQLVLVGGADRRHRPAVEGVGEGDQVVLVGHCP